MLVKAIALLVVVCVVSTVVANESQWNQDARNHILKIHNDYRRNEGGCQIFKLEYDMGLESQAKGWAEGCAFKHEMKKGRGENLAFSTYQHPETQLITDSSKAWFDEKNDYRPGQRSCGRSCHYTQLVWWNTEKVGCYSTRCPFLSGASARNAWYLVCFYTPMGNWMGQEPYKRQCDTPCLPGQKSENGLCAGAPKLPCENKNASCDGWAKRGECDKNKGYMHLNCQKACGVCTR